MTETTTTLVTAWKSAQARLKAAGLDSPAIDARLLLEAATGASRTEIVTDPYRPLTADQVATLEDYLSKRLKRMPVSRILGRKGFWKLMLNINSHVLSPRPETECLVDLILKRTEEGQSFQVADLGVGSGAILLSILAERPAARGLGTDISEEALAVARENAANLGLAGRAAFLRTSWAVGMADDSFDFVASNPPYIRSEVIPTLDPEVKEHDPILALDGGPDGLQAYIELIPDVFRVLKKDGMAYIEIGFDQSEAVEKLMKEAGFINVHTLLDLSTNPRIVIGQKFVL
ncbi:peptide chain release factor N(5)-glutamine methyltransferase [Asticcacaulis sp. SL142]|uniref:peptide chain release factor N(5)-glutamine methyltransferase n=1 Tax=Asticcacaulis sp. SL142 TaxID=2995155 RepID=UPI00226CDC5F|nr:peptide chain release factor N(5)-glutamine methyltransferase [Asticcacaulis sp. SL142]WAC49893.1 peptide chain release factor N(5)-glutamine methyltransferase [Asticcacaulis sp. SL142]